MTETFHSRWTDRVFLAAFSSIGVLLAALIAVIVWLFGPLPEQVRRLTTDVATLQLEVIHVRRQTDDLEPLAALVAAQTTEMKELRRDLDRLDERNRPR